MKDISVMYHSFSEYLQGQYITSEEVLSLLCDAAEDSNIIKDSVIVFDEFTGFTPIQNQLLRKLLVLSERIIVSVTMDAGEDFYHCRGEQELFSMSKKTVSVLMKMAEELHVTVEEPVVLSDGKNHRYKNAPSLYFMEQNLFRPYYHKWRQKEDELRIVSLKNPREELHFVAREITKFVREKQYCYKDIAVVTGDVSLYDNYVDEIFAAYDIPYFLDQTRTILFHPFIEFIRAVLEVVELDFSYESVFRFLRCGLTDITEQQIDLLENYVLAKGIRGRKKWEKQSTFVFDDTEKENLTEMNEVREKIYGFFAPLSEAFTQGKTVRDETTVLYELIEKLEKLGPNSYKDFVLNRLKDSKIEKGEILLQKDMKFHFKEEDFNGLKVSNESVEGGFVVKNGKISYDNTYKSLVNFEKDSLEKIIVDEIFK